MWSTVCGFIFHCNQLRNFYSSKSVFCSSLNFVTNFQVVIFMLRFQAMYFGNFACICIRCAWLFFSSLQFVYIYFSLLCHECISAHCTINNIEFWVPRCCIIDQLKIFTFVIFYILTRVKSPRAWRFANFLCVMHHCERTQQSVCSLKLHFPVHWSCM